jgi:hypothetical protein
MFGPEKSPPMWPPPPMPPPPRFIVTPLAAGPAKPETNKDKIGFQKIACPGLCYFEVCIPPASIRFGSCLLDSYFLDRSFQMHFAGELYGFDKIEEQCTKKRYKRRDRIFFRFLALKVFFSYLAFEKRGSREAPPPISGLNRIKPLILRIGFNG